jgi:ribosomal-protein-alanine N-acetyltransferase
MLDSLFQDGFSVYLDNETEDDAVTLHRWFLKYEPERVTCRLVPDYDEEEVIKRFRKRSEHSGIARFAVRRVEDKKLVGRVTYFDINTRNGSAEIGYMIGGDYQRKNYATDGMILLLGHLFCDLGLRKVMAQTGEFNKPSVALLNKLGFKQDGRLRQHHELDGKFYDDLIFSLMSDEFQID